MMAHSVDDASTAVPSTSCTSICFTITMFQYYICSVIVLTVILVLGLGLVFFFFLNFVIGTEVTATATAVATEQRQPGRTGNRGGPIICRDRRGQRIILR